LQLLRQHGRLILRIEALESALRRDEADVDLLQAPPAASPAGLPVGTKAPEFELPTLDGGRASLVGLLSAHKPVMLAFVQPDCGPCQALMPEIAEWQRTLADRVTIAVISGRSAEGSSAVGESNELSHLLLQEDGEVATSYSSHGTPSAVIVRSDGSVGSALAMGADAIRVLVRNATQAQATVIQMPKTDGSGIGASAGGGRQAPAVADPAPALRLPELGGEMIDLADFRGQRTVLLFWNPSCGFCQQMLEDLRAWERERDDAAPELVVVSSGSLDANRAMGLLSPVLLDPSSQAMTEFGARGTPMAALIDEHGRVASDVAAGAQAVFGLLGSASRQAAISRSP
jgi:peroxiredoxin